MNLLLATTLDISMVLGLALAAVALLRRRSAALRHWILAAAIGCALMTPALELVVPAWHLLPARSPEDVVIEPGTLASYATTVTSDPAAITTGTFTVGTLLTDVPIGWLLVLMWLSGVVVAVAIVLIGLTRLGVFARRAERVRDRAWNEMAANASRAHGLDRPFLLLCSEHPTLVVTWGLFRPRVMLPDGARRWSSERLRVVLFHEAAHIKRGDWGIQMAASLLRCVYWFNPLVWMACRALRNESERACDDLVLKAGVHGEDYARHLLAVAREAVLLRRWSPATAIAHPSTLEGRIRAMLNARLNRQPLTRVARVATAAALLIATLLLTAASLSREITAAQGGPGSITATIYDQHCGLLPGVAVSARHASAGRIYDGVTDHTGSFTFRSLPPGV
jgi:beta-lactamase regulating signal transducer with metallopeptidase domain